MVSVVSDICDPLAKVSFILESPHRDEMKTGIPLSGVSGTVLTNMLGLNCAINQFALDTKKLNIINSFLEPLQLSSNLAALNSKVRAVTFNGPAQYKNDLIDVFTTESIVPELQSNYIDRVTSVIKDNHSVIVFGFVAQAWFEYCFSVSATFGTYSCVQICGSSVNVMYLQHPSPKTVSKSRHYQPGTSENTYIRELLQ